YIGGKGRSAMLPLLMLACLVQAQEPLDVTAVGKDPRWQVAGRTTAVVDTNGKRALRMIEVAPLMGLVWLKDYDFDNGTTAVERPKVSVFVTGAATAALVVNELSDRARGSVGLWAGDGSAGIFANLRVTRKP